MRVGGADRLVRPNKLVGRTGGTRDLPGGEELAPSQTARETDDSYIEMSTSCPRPSRWRTPSAARMPIVA